MTLFRVKLVGFTAGTGVKLLFTLALVVFDVGLHWLVRWGMHSLSEVRRAPSTRFSTRQAANIITAVVLVAGLLSIWANSPTRLATFLGLVTAGVAFALQSVITAIAGYIVILRGGVFRVGDRIVMGGVRGDVIAVGLLHTTIMEMG